ncbi:MAG: sugar phosphate isomerase/epimerase family protein [Pirellulaceae bacterium]
MMRKAIVIRAFSASSNFLDGAEFLQSEDDYARCFDKAAQLGFDGIQLFVSRQGYLSLEGDDVRAQAVAQRARSSGMALTSLEIEPFSFSLTDDDVAVRAQGEATVRRALQMAAAMEAPGVLVIPGYVGLPWDPSVPPVRYDLAYDRLRNCLQTLAPAAEYVGCPILIENIWNMFLVSPLEMRQLIDEVASPQVGVLFDTGNVVQFGFPEQWIRILGRRIREVHLKDFRRTVGTVAGFVSLLEGDVNWPEVMAALGEISYDGFLTAEVFPYAHHGETVLAHTSETMDRLMKRARV